MLRKVLVVIGLISITSMPVLAEVPGSKALIDALEQAYDHTRIYFTAHTEEVSSPLGVESEPVERHYEQRYCRDGRKLDITLRHDTPDAAAPVQIQRYIVTPEKRVSLRRAPTVESRPTVVQTAPGREDREVARDLLRGGQALDGYLAHDTEPLPKLLREAKRLSVRPEREQVDDVACAVLEAVSRHGRYTVWVDETQGATIRKAEVVKQNGDRYSAMRKLGELKIDGTPVAQTRYRLENVAVDTVAGKPLPVRATVETTYILADGRNYTVRQEHQREALDLDPDFKALDAFRVDVPENAVYTDKTASR